MDNTSFLERNHMNDRSFPHSRVCCNILFEQVFFAMLVDLAGRYIDIATGMVRRHVLGQTSFYIYISGTVKVDEKK